MPLVIDVARSLADLAHLNSLHQAVFERELGIRLPALRAMSDASYIHLIAREDLNGTVVAGLTVLETSGDLVVHRRYGLNLPDRTAAARYTRLAVLPAYRGQHLPLKLILRAHQVFVEPREIRHTWLMFDARRAANTDLCRVLGYRAVPRVVDTEYGKRCALIRDEFSPSAISANRIAAQFVNRLGTDEYAAAGVQFEGVA